MNKLKRTLALSVSTEVKVMNWLYEGITANRKKKMNKNVYLLSGKRQLGGKKIKNNNKKSNV